MLLKAYFLRSDRTRKKFLRYREKERLITVFADSRSEADDLKKISSAESTPYYEADSPNGKVSFTPADLVIGGGKIKDSKGNWFKPKNIRGKSLAQKVNSKGFGRVREEEMNKKSYRSSPVKGCKTKLSPKDLLTPPSAEEGLTGEPGGGIGRGYSVPGEPTSAYAPDSERSLDLY